MMFMISTPQWGHATNTAPTARTPPSWFCYMSAERFFSRVSKPGAFPLEIPGEKDNVKSPGQKKNPGFLGLVEGWGWRTLIGWTHSGHPALLFSGCKISFKVWKRICSWRTAKSRLFWVSLWFPLSQQNVPAELHGGKEVTKIKRILNKTNIRQIWLLR